MIERGERESSGYLGSIGGESNDGHQGLALRGHPGADIGYLLVPLLQAALLELSNVLRGLEAVHDRHLTVHEHQPVVPLL